MPIADNHLVAAIAKMSHNRHPDPDQASSCTSNDDLAIVHHPSLAPSPPPMTWRGARSCRLAGSDTFAPLTPSRWVGAIKLPFRPFSSLGSITHRISSGWSFKATKEPVFCLFPSMILPILRFPLKTKSVITPSRGFWWWVWVGVFW